MSNVNVSCGWVILLFVMTVMAGCSNEGNRDRMDVQGVLRIKTDTARNRLWVLGLDSVRVYDTVKKRLIRQMELPSWSVARFVCMPDMAMDRSGSAYISSNAQPKLWRIDADSFEVRVHEISLHGREQWDFGFGALAFAADGTLLALTSPVGSLWRIDVGKASARIVEENSSLRDVCELTPQFLNDFERSQKP
jgi:hypothetical protein